MATYYTNPTHFQILRLLKTEDKKEIRKLLKAADLTRRENVGKQVCIHGIIEFSNYCRSLCLYCGLRAQNTRHNHNNENPAKYRNANLSTVQRSWDSRRMAEKKIILARYRMPLEEIKETAICAVKNLGYKMLVLQSGEDLWYDAEKLEWLIKEILKNANCLLFLSIGNRDYKTYEKLYKVGARGSLFRFETSDEKLYKKMHPDCSLKERLRQLKFMKTIGYLLATGPIIGLPGQTFDSLINDIFLIKNLGATMASMGPYVPTPNTPLGEKFFRENPRFNPRQSANREAIELTLKMIALTRLVYPKVRIPITTALEKLGGNNARRRALKGGANAFMLNLTPPQYRQHYQIYTDKNKMQFHLHSKKAAGELKNLIKSCGRNVCLGWGEDYALTDKEFEKGCSR